MTTDSSVTVLLLATALASSACYQPLPPGLFDDADDVDESAIEDEGATSRDEGDEGDGDEGDEGTTGSESNDIRDGLYPLVDGARWTYVTKNPYGQILQTQAVEIHETVWKGMPAWELVEEPDIDGDWDVSTIIRAEGLSLRVHREEQGSFGPTEILDYDPGFPRANEAWNAVGLEQELAYDRTAYDGSGQHPEIEARAHTYEVLAIDEPVTVPAGTFHCVKVERIRTLGAEAGALVWFWFAPGVGKVREERPIEMEIEELVSVTIPGGANYP